MVSKYIQFEQGGPYTTAELDFYISKSKINDNIKFTNCYKNNDRTIYLASNIE